MIGPEAPRSFPRIERLLKHHGFVPQTVEAVALSLGPMCQKCIKAWAEELDSK
jgi:hypothetical protein